MTGKTKNKAEQIRKESQIVTVMATCGNLPLQSEDVEWVNNNTTKKIPEIAVKFGDSGVAVLDPAKPADKAVLDMLLPWLEEGEDERIEQHAVRVVRNSNLLPPYPNWDMHTVAKCVSRVVEDGFDPELALRYELQKEDPRGDLVEKLNELLDKPIAEDPLAVPTLD